MKTLRWMLGVGLLLAAGGAVRAEHSPGPWAGPQDGQERSSELDAATLAKARSSFALVSKRLAKVVELHAGYLQEQESLLLAEPLVSKGQFHLRLAPECLVLDLTEPSPARIRSDGTSHRVYDPKAGRAEVFRFDENRLTKALIACFRADLEQLETIFVIAAYAERVESVETDETLGKLGEPQSRRLGQVDLLPKAKELADVMRKLTLVLDLDQGLPVRVVQENREGEQVAFELTEPQLLEKPHKDSARLFSEELPKGTQVVERRIDPK